VWGILDAQSPEDLDPASNSLSPEYMEFCVSPDVKDNGFYGASDNPVPPTGSEPSAWVLDQESVELQPQLSRPSRRLSGLATP